MHQQVFLGQALHQLDTLLPANSLPLDDILAAALLIFFGVKTLLVRPGSVPGAALWLQGCAGHPAGALHHWRVPAG